MLASGVLSKGIPFVCTTTTPASTARRRRATIVVPTSSSTKATTAAMPTPKAARSAIYWRSKVLPSKVRWKGVAAIPDVPQVWRNIAPTSIVKCHLLNTAGSNETAA